MARLKTAKIVSGAELAEDFAGSASAVVAEYRGVSAEDLAQLRRDLRELDAEFKVVKNRVAIKAIQSKAESFHSIVENLKGPVGLALIKGDPAQSAKVLFKFAKENQKFKITAGVLDGAALTEEDLKRISDLPSKEVLIAKMIGSLIAPHRGLLTVLNGVGTKLVRVISAVRDTKS